MLAGDRWVAGADPVTVAAHLDAAESPYGWLVGYGAYTRRFWARQARSADPVWLTAATGEELRERMRAHEVTRRTRRGMPPGTSGRR